MSVVYQFSSLRSLADYLDNYGRSIAERIEKARPKERDLLRREAATYALIANLIRSTVIGGVK